MFEKTRKLFRSLKINAKKAGFVLVIGIIEVIAILGFNNWEFTPWIFIAVVDTLAIFDKKEN